jgi:hypothetical protein
LWVHIANTDDERHACQSLLALSSGTVGVHDFISPRNGQGPQDRLARVRLLNGLGSRARSVRTWRGLRPRRVGWALALACLSVLPSDSVKSVGTQDGVIVAAQ